MNYSELLQLAKGWSNFKFERIIIWRLQIKREVCEKSMEKQVEIYQNEIKKLLEENKRLKRENIMLTKKLERLTMK